VTLLQTNTTLEDGVAMFFPNAAGLTLGSIVEGDSREATWRFRIDTPGSKCFRLFLQMTLSRHSPCRVDQ
jgi:hypothetical protein